MIAINEMCKTYGDSQQVRVQALDHISFRVADGEFVAIMGPSGSGKSSLMHVLGCLDGFESGSYCLCGEEVKGLSASKLAHIRSRTIGFVFQSFYLLPQLSARENVELPLVYQGVSAAKRHERAQAMLSRLGLSYRAEHKPEQLSGGQRQRVAIGRALINHPPLLLADEPTGNLDVETGREIMALFHELHEQGTTIVLITHEPDIAAHAQRRLVLCDGKLYPA